MNKKLLAVTALASAIATQFVCTSNAHTISFGFENAGPGTITVWGGSYHSFPTSPATQGQLLLTPTGGGAPISVPFTLSVGVMPGGLIDGVTNFYAGGATLVNSDPGIGGGVQSWQGATVSGLSAGNFTIQYDPAFSIPSAGWEPWDASIRGGSAVFISAAVIGSASSITPPVLTLLVVDVGAVHSLLASGLPFALAQRQVLFNVAENANRDLNARLFRLRAQIAESGSAGPKGFSMNAKEAKPILAPEKRWEFFVSGNYGNRDVDTIGSTAGFDTDLFTATLGFEYKIKPQLAVGLAVTRVHSDNDLGTLGSSELEGYSFAAYVSCFCNNFYADLLYSLGSYNHQIHRNTGLGRTATARPDSLTNSLQFNTGYNLHLGRVVTGPIVSLDWVHGDIDGYTEDRGGNANVTVNDQDADSLISRLGWQVSMPMRTGFGLITPQVRASWVHEYLNDNQQVGASLVTSPYYLVTGATVTNIGGFNSRSNAQAPGNDYLSAGGGVGIQFGDNVSVVVDYETRVFQSDSVSHNVSLTASIKF